MRKLFLGNLPFNASEAELRAMLEEFGTLESLQMITDRDTGKPRGFAFAEIADDHQADEVIKQLNGKEWKGRALNINDARPQREHGGGGGGGGFRPRRGPGGGGSGGGRGGGGGGFRDRDR